MSNTLAPCPQCESINRVPIARSELETPLCGKCKNPLPIEHGVVEVSGSALQHLIDRSPLPILTDFWAPWCVPCRAFKPEFEKAANRFADQYVFTRLNTMEHALAADLYRIRTLPTLIVFRSGQEVERHFGAISADALASWLHSIATQKSAA